MLTETQTPALLSGQLSQHTVHTIPATVTGRAGEGVLLAVKQHLPYSVSHWQTDQANNVIWLTLKSAQSSQLPLTLGVCYIPPQSSMSPQLRRRSAQLRFGSLAAHLADASARGHVLLAGDFAPLLMCQPSPASRPAATLNPPALTMFWWMLSFSMLFRAVALGLSGQSQTTFL